MGAFLALGLSTFAGYLAARKGYSFLLWFFTSILGVIILLFLPNLHRPDLSFEEEARLRRRGNWIGGVIALLALTFTILNHLHI